jgi:NADPH:quinone reductase
MLSNQWTVHDFYPIDYIPRGVRLTAYHGDATDLPSEVLQRFLDDVAAGRLTVPLHRTYTLDEISFAHADMEAGKLVVVPGVQRPSGDGASVGLAPATPKGPRGCFGLACGRASR